MDRLDISTVTGGLKAALGMNVPLYIPPGLYDVPKYVCDTNIDIEGAGDDTSLRVSGNPWTAGKGLIKLAKLRLQGMTVGGMHNLVGCDAAQVDPPHIEFCHVKSKGVGLVNWGEYADRGLTIQHLIAKDCEIRDAIRPFMVNGGAARVVDVDGMLIDGFERFGFMVCASSKSSQERCAHGTIRNVQVVNGRSVAKPNNNAFYVGTRYLELTGLTISNWNYKRPDGTTNDNEPGYAKTDHLWAENIVICNGGGGQGCFAAKGFIRTSSPDGLGGGDYTFRNVYIECPVTTGTGWMGMWLQARGKHELVNVTTKNLGVQFETHQQMDADVVVDNWRAWDVAPGCKRLIIAMGHGTLAIKNSQFPPEPWLFDSNYPADLVVTIQNTPGVKLRPNELGWVVDAKTAATETVPAATAAEIKTVASLKDGPAPDGEKAYGSE
jgi:hypothetical protein